MVAAAITLWMMFSVWLLAPLVGMPRATARVAMTLLSVELCALFVWSYGAEGCDESTCAPVARAAGVAARMDVPALAAAFLVATILRLRRR